MPSEYIAEARAAREASYNLISDHGTFAETVENVILELEALTHAATGPLAIAAADEGSYGPASAVQALQKPLAEAYRTLSGSVATLGRIVG